MQVIMIIANRRVMTRMPPVSRHYAALRSGCCWPKASGLQPQASRHYATLRCRLLLAPPPVSRSPVTPFGHCMTSLRSGCCWPLATSH